MDSLFWCALANLGNLSYNAGDAFVPLNPYLRKKVGFVLVGAFQPYRLPKISHFLLFFSLQSSHLLAVGEVLCWSATHRLEGQEKEKSDFSLPCTAISAKSASWELNEMANAIVLAPHEKSKFLGAGSI